MVILPICLILGIVAGDTESPDSLPTHDPNRTITVFVPGFDPDGSSQSGPFGIDVLDPLITNLADLAGLPDINTPGDEYLPSVVLATDYYGDLPPAYYDAQDYVDLDDVMATWGGGIPRYALVIAKYARFAMDRAGADQVNFVSASMGGLVARWLIENDSDGLASEGRIARWLSLEGVISGNWAASNNVLMFLWDLFGTPSIDVDHMRYDWIQEHIQSPRTHADSPFYGDILLGMERSTRDSANDGLLSDAMWLLEDWEPNDGVQAVGDMYFHTISSQSRFLAQTPVMPWFHVNHYEIAQEQPAWLQIGNFITGNCRVRVTLTEVNLHDPHEPDDWWWDWMPAEVVFDTEVRSPAAEVDHDITGSIGTLGYDGGASPIHPIVARDTWQSVEHVFFDDFTTPSESILDVTLGAWEVDWDDRYDMSELLGGSETFDDHTETISIDVPGTFHREFSAGDWSGRLRIEVIAYPFADLGDAIPGDIDGDGQVGITDLLALLDEWGPCPPPCAADLNGDGTVGITDLLILLDHWG
jgi:hypothetical protein